MKVTMRILLLIMLFSIQNLFSQTKTVKPEQVFAMYFDTFVKQDQNALQELNSYLTPFLGSENTYTINLEKSFNDEVQNLTAMFLSSLPKDKAADCKIEAEQYFKTVLNNLKNTGYTVKSIKEVKNEYADNSFVTELSVDIRFPVPAQISQLKPEEIKKMSAQDLKNHLKSKTNEFAKSESEMSANQVFKLYQVKKEGNTYYWNGGPQELVWKLNELYFKSLSR